MKGSVLIIFLFLAGLSLASCSYVQSDQQGTGEASQDNLSLGEADVASELCEERIMTTHETHEVYSQEPCVLTIIGNNNTVSVLEHSFYVRIEVIGNGNDIHIPSDLGFIVTDNGQDNSISFD
ncbi:MAG: hypothetical protein H6502_04905 [Candidatus Woesearchaeota archaeon]|nr:MAG: hypothetical protein H6502_04905 [Candidatus Woesearchaeota archaeon]